MSETTTTGGTEILHVFEATNIPNLRALNGNDGTDILDIFENRLRSKKSDGTADHRRSHLKQFRGWLRANGGPQLLEVKSYDVEDHFDAMRETHTDITATGRLDAINAFYQWLQNDKDRLNDKHGIIIEREDNPAEGLLEDYEDIDFSTKKSQVYDEGIVALTREETEKLVKRENVPEPKTRNQLLLKLLVQTGMRVSEIIAVEIDDIDRQERRIRVRDQKNNRRRTAFYQPSVDPLLTKWIDGGLRETNTTASESDKLFITYKKPYMVKSAVRDVVHKAAQNADIQDDMYEEEATGHTRWKVTPHTLRHTFGRFAVTGDNPMDISRLARLMGHMDKEGNPNIQTTKKYLAFTEDDLRDASQASIPDI
jgi:integrase/recombinase XerD